MPENTLTAAEIAGKPSHDDIRTMIARALFGDGYGSGDAWIYEIADGNCVVSRGHLGANAQHLRYSYTIEGDQVTLGDPVPVKLSWRDVPVQASEERGTRCFATDLQGLRFSESQGDIVRIEVCRDGTWQHQKYGEVKVTPEMRASFIANFNANVRKVGELPLDYDHDHTPAPGWITALESEGNSLYADVRLTPSGRKSIEDGEYRFFSPEWHPDWEDPETGAKHGPTLFGGGLTNKPFFRGMAALQCSEPTGAPPQETPTPMPENTQTGQDTPAPMTAAEVQQMRDRMTAVEAENAGLRAAEDRRGVSLTFSEMAFGENSRRKLAPTSQTALTDALMAIPSAQRQPVIEAIRSMQFAELGERGFVVGEESTPGANAVKFTASEEALMASEAKRRNLTVEQVRTAWTEARQAQIAEGRFRA